MLIDFNERRKNRAPKDEGEMPEERRCPNCWRILSLLETSSGTTVEWCSNCQYVVRKK